MLLNGKGLEQGVKYRNMYQYMLIINSIKINNTVYIVLAIPKVSAIFNWYYTLYCVSGASKSDIICEIIIVKWGYVSYIVIPIYHITYHIVRYVYQCVISKYIKHTTIYIKNKLLESISQGTTMEKCYKLMTHKILVNKYIEVSN